MKVSLEESLRDRVNVYEAVRQSDYLEHLNQAITVVAGALKAGKKVLIAGNGGSAADSQHIAAELVGRFQMERRALPAIALTVDTSILTAIGNDYDFDAIFARQVEGLGQAGDVFIGITTSGDSPNIVKAAEAARQAGLSVVAFCGNKKGGGAMKNLADVALIVPATVTALVQEVHQFSYHTLCDAVEHQLFDAE